MSAACVTQWRRASCVRLCLSLSLRHWEALVGGLSACRPVRPLLLVDFSSSACRRLFVKPRTPCPACGVQQHLQASRSLQPKGWGSILQPNPGHTGNVGLCIACMTVGSEKHSV